MHASEIGFMRNNPLHVSATTVTIIRDVIKKEKNELRTDTIIEVTELIRDI
jgi:hypothetical protein